MTIHRIKTARPSLTLLWRVVLALLVMILAERAADNSHGEPSPAQDLLNEPEAEESASKSESSQPRYTSTPATETSSSSSQRLREGTILTDVIGRFKVSGDQATFIIKETGLSFGGLENLNLARVATILQDDPEADWSISGLVTEYRGQNYLLIQKAIRKTGGVENKAKLKIAAPPSVLPTETQEANTETAAALAE